MSEIKGFHAHVYFDQSTVAKARALCTTCRDTFGVEMGRVHEKPVGPHPDWSCQLAFGPDKFADIIAVDGSPLEDIAQLLDVDFVMKSGKIYKD